MLMFDSAGVTDSRLTNHGILQTKRLGEYFVSNNIRFTQIFASDLQRARITAEAVRDAQLQSKSKEKGGPIPEVVQLQILREQDFGSYECSKWSSKATENDVLPNAANSDFVPKETKQAMRARADEFLDDYFTPLLYLESAEEESVAVVSHGLLLATLWKTLLARFPERSVSLGPNVGTKGGSQLLEYLPGWSNTGYLELWIKRLPDASTSSQSNGTATIETTPKMNSWQMTIVKVNAKYHLENLKRARGGLGSATHDVRQQNLDNFFKKPKIANPAS